MTDDDLFDLLKRIDPRAVRLPPGIKELAVEIAAVERKECAKICRDLENSGTEPTGEICAMAIESRAYAL